MRWILVAAVASCTSASPSPAPPAASPAAGPATAPAAPAAPAAGSAAWACTALPFAQSTPVPEASGAAWLTIAGKLVLVTMGDSDQDGAYGLLDPDTGATLEQGKLPLGEPGDDLEGLASRHGLLYGLTSAGWMRTWKRVAHGFELVDGPYAIGSGEMICKKPTKSNCARNYEGLALSEDAAGPCLGVALSKEDGTLYCLSEEADRLVVHADLALHVGRKKAVADCALDETGALWVGDNGFGLNLVQRVTGWRDPAHAQIEEIGAYGTGFSEAIAVRGDTVYRLSDLGGAPSLMAKFRCAPITR